jgi:effector-binding domain-containing protein
MPQTYAIEIKDVRPERVMSIRTRVPRDGMAACLRDGFGELNGYLQRAGVSPAGPQLAIYHELGDVEADVELCVPVREPLGGAGRVVPRELPDATVVSTIHAGPYETEADAYVALTRWMEEHGHGPAGPRREVYLVGPADTADPSEYRTAIVWPVH